MKRDTSCVMAKRWFRNGKTMSEVTAAQKFVEVLA